MSGETETNSDYAIYLNDASKLGHTGVLIDVILPSGIVIDLWVYEDQLTTSIDVRRTVAGRFVPLNRVIALPAASSPSAVAVVIENRKEP